MTHRSRNATAIILARGGSKGLPGKNHALVAGQPCVQWTIDAAKQAHTIAQIVVSSDDPEVLEISNQNGCTSIERPADLAHDTATIDDAARHAYQQIGSPDTPIVILYANVPVRPDTLIDDAVNLLVESRAHSVQSYARVGKHHPWWTVKLTDENNVLPWEGDTLYHNCFRRQDLPPAHIPDGGVIALTPDALMLRTNAPSGPHQFLGTDRRGIETQEGDVIDIDSRIDLLVADAILSEKAASHISQP
ncbi:MAG: acylneuraminate cytidylyltransferase family protein [Phycisphaerales bacterium]|nr:acylneuraminate cytidylyltransferase family protein [Phycisphaerales bacterium]